VADEAKLGLLARPLAVEPGVRIGGRGTIRKRIEEAFGWIKTVAGQAKTRFRGLERVGFAFTFAAASYNLLRLPKLLAEAPA